MRSVRFHRVILLGSLGVSGCTCEPILPLPFASGAPGAADDFSQVDDDAGGGSASSGMAGNGATGGSSSPTITSSDGAGGATGSATGSSARGPGSGLGGDGAGNGAGDAGGGTTATTTASATGTGGDSNDGEGAAGSGTAAAGGGGAISGQAGAGSEVPHPPGCPCCADAGAGSPEMVCVPGTTASCYTGPAGTAGIGVCASGMRLCDLTGTFGPCLGEVTPAAESCFSPDDEDCDGEVDDGCICQPNAATSCYSGPPGTEAQGPCKVGTQTCDATGTALGACMGEVLPATEVCGNDVDEDCDGDVDDTDADGDGWGICTGDCCDVPGECARPNLVNPGAFEIPGNGVDDDCDPTTDDLAFETGCSDAGAKLSGVTAIDVARAMDICGADSQGLPLPEGKWGILEAKLLLANGASPSDVQLGNLQSSQIAVLADYGNASGFSPQRGPTMAGLSTGRMRDKSDFGAQTAGTAFGVASEPPSSWLAAHGGSLPSKAGCNGDCPSGSGAFDPVNVSLTIRVPTNATAFQYRFNFLTAEYARPCSKANDFHLALLTSAAPGNPADGNIAVDGLGHALSLNEASFDVCTPKLCFACASGSSKLADTGLSTTPSTSAAATGWTSARARVAAGETMVLELMVFDVSDATVDTVVLLDDFQWVSQ